MAGSNNNEVRTGVTQFIKFALVGVANTLVDMVIGLVLNGLFGLYYLAKVIGYCCGIVNSYILNSSWTFKKERKRDAREMISFLAVNLVVLGISLGLLWLFPTLGLTDEWVSTWCPSWLSWLLNGERVCMILSTGICIIVNFIGNKFFVFKRKEQTEEVVK